MRNETTGIIYKNVTFDLITQEIPTQQKAYICVTKAPNFSGIEEMLHQFVPELFILGAKKVFVCCKDAATPLPEDTFSVGKAVFKYDHKIIGMTLDPMKKASPEKTPNIILLPLTPLLANAYLELYNSGFATVSNSSTYTIEDITRLLYNPQFEGGIIQVNGDNAGIYELSYEQDVPEVASVALSPAFRGRGYGKKSFRSVLYKLEQKGFRDARLLVSTKNIEALSLYQNLGFEQNIEYSKWYVCEAPSK